MTRIASSTRTGQGGAQRPVVAAFGKHPAWDDHTDYLGRASPAIATVLEWLYEVGVRGCIESDLWGKVGEPVEFAHAFVWRVPVKGVLATGSELVAGRLWASKDGRGRDKYPMVVCAAGAAGGLPHTLATLNRARMSMAASGAAQQDVLAALGDAETALADGHERAAADGLDPASAVQGLSELRRAGLLGTGDEGLYRIMWEMQRELGGFAPGAGRATAKLASEGTGHHLRVPAPVAGPEADATTGQAAALRTWMGVMLAQLAPGVPVLVIAPSGGRWADVVVGRPTPELLACLRLGPTDLPLASEIPYEFSDEFRRSCDDKLAAWARAAPSAASATDVGADLRSDDTDADASRAGGGSAGRRGRPNVVIEDTAPLSASLPVRAARRVHPGVLIGIGIAAVVIVVVIALLIAGGGGGPSDARGAAPPPRPPGAGRSAPAQVQPAEPSTATTSTPSAAEPLPLRTPATPPAPPIAVGATGLATIDAPSPPSSPSHSATGTADRWATEAARAAWATATARAATAPDPAAARKRVDQLAVLLTRLEREIPGSEALDAPGARDIAAFVAPVARRIDADRSAAVHRALQESGGLDPDSKAYASKLEAAAAEQGASIARARELLSAVDGFARALAAGGAWTIEPSGTGDSPSARWAALVATPGAAEHSTTIAPLRARADRLKGLALATDRTTLLEAITSVGDGSLTEASTAWAVLRLQGPSATAAQLGELKAAIAAAEAVRPLAETPGFDTTRRAMRAAFRSDWAALVRAARDGPAIAALADVAASESDAGPMLAALDQRDAWNIRLALLHAQLSRGAGSTTAERSADDAETRRVLRRFIDERSADATALGSPAQLLLARLAETLPEDQRAPFAPERDGPAASGGWRFEGVGPGGTVERGPLVYVFSPPGGRAPRRLEFWPVEVDGRRTWLADREVSVGLFAEVVQAAGASAKLEGLMPLDVLDGHVQEWAGPRAWGVRLQTGRGSADWATLAPNPARGREAGRGWLHVPEAATALRLYPEPDKVPVPTDESPMQMLSPEAAVMAARLMGCRLPTAAEFAAAVATASAPAADSSVLPPNLRDATFERTWQHMRSTLRQIDFADPLTTAFRGASPATGDWQDAAPPTPQPPDDGVVWFDDVASPRGRPFKNIVGNVAEFVLPADAQLALDPRTPARRPEWARSGTLAVAGGSALSPAGRTRLFADPAKAVAVASPSAETALLAFGDVGFRLAFSPRDEGDSRPVRVRAAAVIAQAGYLLPPAPAPGPR